jgi:hypothetical protein
VSLETYPTSSVSDPEDPGYGDPDHRRQGEDVRTDAVRQGAAVVVERRREAPSGAHLTNLPFRSFFSTGIMAHAFVLPQPERSMQLPVDSLSPCQTTRIKIASRLLTGAKMVTVFESISGSPDVHFER